MQIGFQTPPCDPVICDAVVIHWNANQIQLARRRFWCVFERFELTNRQPSLPFVTAILLWQALGSN